MSNVVILMSDEHNPKFSSVYGHPTVSTPNMERLARSGTTYDAAYCPSPLCAPCRSSFMSGLPVYQIQVYNNCSVFQFDYPTYGSVLAQQGIHTVHIGKTDVYAAADSLGFTEILAPHDRAAPGDINFRRQPLAIRTDSEVRAAQFGVRESAFTEDISTIDLALDWLATRATSCEKPWTLTVNIKAPHFPHFVTEELWQRYSGEADMPEYGIDAESANHPYATDLRTHFQTHVFTEEQIRGQRQGYLGRVDFVDSQLGRLLDALETNGLREDTVVAYTSDHGEMLGKFGMWWKSSMYDDSVRVPLIVSGPGFAADIRVDTPVSLLDVQATMFEATRATRPLEWWGAPLQSVVPGDRDREVFSEYHGHGTRSGSFMIRQGPWKLLYHAAAPHQLFNLEDDPEELRNLFENKPRKASQLVADLYRLCSPNVESRRAHEFEEVQYERVAHPVTH